MAFLNFVKSGSYTKIKEILYNKEVGNIDLIFEVLTEKDGDELIPDFTNKISKIVETEKFKEEGTAKLNPPPNSKSEEQTQEEYDAEVNAYTIATQTILDEAPVNNAFSLHFSKDALYGESNIEALCYEWVKKLDLFEGVEDA